MKTGSTSGEAVSLKSFFRILLFGCILALLLTIAGIVLNPGKFFLEGHIKDRNARYAEIMTVPRDCIDIYNVGNSLAMVGISPSVKALPARRRLIICCGTASNISIPG